MKESKKSRAILSCIVVCFGVLIVSLCIFMQYHHHAAPKVVSTNSYQTIAKKQVSFNIETLLFRNRVYSEVAGWIYVKNQEPQKYITSLVLYNDKSNKCLVFPLTMVKRPDVAKMRKKVNNYPYMNAGFDGFIPVNYMVQGKYKVGFLVADKDEPKLIKTGVPYKQGGVR
ncbi:hypothetical protein BVJ53_06485 [Lacticaseibacillus chiayiensis]|uniref:Uncharacterized protein n=1 Tax=Lacticaseibacillus chiayiensis TaxID=2100821 RepID=A0A4Q1U2R3_9LACO|nr:hypothetical protein [Lacticaseibacillus chiayiensis]RXT25037.1 hypothetical protein BVJ53_06485 [Lacticaseibacillus chiayiensis]UYN55674.1 hypothetical protein OFW50_09260 [Lacticaseibacillus chiayiensis]